MLHTKASLCSFSSYNCFLLVSCVVGPRPDIIYDGIIWEFLSSAWFVNFKLCDCHQTKRRLLAMGDRNIFRLMNQENYYDHSLLVNASEVIRFSSNNRIVKDEYG